ncbi:uncharacterized protein LOC118746544 [Rhagoletis pomonella]|uniref:uncharacterized protein LOC118746544 n=1 Tax=Rhagoletis pomonella TaxID=28610 RepID=UPI00177F61DD|nr:uncharacterized protein LOC118746544 [Rhagoletis pomonella]
MLDFFLGNKGLAEGKFSAIHGRQEASRKWEELAMLLNSSNGAEKSAAQWQVVWRDLKSRTSVKARERRKQMAATGNAPMLTAPLSDLDQKVLSLLGTEYVEGSSQCVESIPEEDSLQISLENGDASVLVDYPVVSIAEAAPIPVEATQSTGTKNASTSRRTSTLKRKSVMESTREIFAKVAKQQADAMMMQTEAAKVQAESAKQHVEAMLLQAQAYVRVANALEDLTSSVKLLVNNTVLEF